MSLFYGECIGLRSVSSAYNARTLIGGVSCRPLFAAPTDDAKHCREIAGWEKSAVRLNLPIFQCLSLGLVVCRSVSGDRIYEIRL